MSHSFFAYIARMRYISRWGLMRNTDPENVQEHSHMVAVLAHALVLIQNRYYGGTLDPGQAVLLALYHDATEMLTRDLPTPIKYYNPAIRDAYKARCVNLGRHVTFDGGEGTALDVDEEGRLVVQGAEGSTHVFTGEVSVHGIYGAV